MRFAKSLIVTPLIFIGESGVVRILMVKICRAGGSSTGFGVSVLSLICVWLVLAGSPIVYAEQQKTLLSAAHIVASPTITQSEVSPPISVQRTPITQFQYPVHNLDPISSGVPLTKEVAATLMQPSPLLPAPPVQPLASVTNSSVSSPVINQALPSPIQPAPVLQPPPVQIIQQPATTGSVFQPGTTFPFVPTQSSTFPPSVFPPTTTGASALGPEPLGTSSGSTNLSPWFPSLPAIGCGGTFSLTIVGDVSSSSTSSKSDQTSSSSSDNNSNNNNNHHNHSHQGTKALALQVNSAGGVDLTQESVNGQLFQGQNNINNNQGNKFDIKDVFNNCQVITFSR